jgi:hypothetical protein
MRVLKAPLMLRTGDDWIVACEGCGAQIDGRELREAGWVTAPDLGGGEHHPLCRPCSRRELGGYATFLLNGNRRWLQAWQWFPVVIVILAIVHWDLPGRFVVQGDVSILIVAALAGALVAGVLRLYMVAHMLYVRRRVVAWRRRTRGHTGAESSTI